MPLRDYQCHAFEAAMEYMQGNIQPCVIEAPTGAGKSHIIAAIAEQTYSISKKRILCLAPNAKLVKQNRSKYLQTGNPASVYSASAGSKCFKHKVVFGTPLSVKNAIEKIAKEVACVIIDEAHSTTPTIRATIGAIRKHNPRLRAVGLTATPYTMGGGYIYAFDENGEAVEETLEPYYHRLVYRISAQELISKGYLTRPTIGGAASGYSTLHIDADQKLLDQAVEGQGRKTAAIVADIVEQSRGRNGVMIFAANRNHAQEIMDSLPPALSGMVTGATKDNDKTLEDFAAQKIKYLVSVEMLTTGYDADHVDVIALLRATESASLMQQIIGRGLRIKDGKVDSLVLDYAENIERHAPDGDIFNPEITAPKKKGEATKVTATCAWCGCDNNFSKRHDMEEYDHDKWGYAVDLEGERIVSENHTLSSSEGKPYVPVHYGRRCFGIDMQLGERCSYRWTYKACDNCQAENDIAARRCWKCKEEIVDPNEKLRLEFARKKADPYQVSTSAVRKWEVRDTVSQAGNPMYRVKYWTDYAVVEAFYPYGKKNRATDTFVVMTKKGTVMPETITYYKDRSSKFWRVIDYNRREDEVPKLA